MKKIIVFRNTSSISETDNYDATTLIEEELDKLYDKKDGKVYMITLEEVEKLWG